MGGFPGAREALIPIPPLTPTGGRHGGHPGAGSRPDRPEFKLEGPGGQFVTLAEYRQRKNVVLGFCPLAFWPVCAHQLPLIEKQLRRLRELEAEVL